MSQDSIGPRIAALYELQAAYLEPKLKELGLNWASFQLLSAVFVSEGKTSQAEISRRLGITPATMSEAVYLHVQKGLLDQVPSSQDRRVRLLKLTKKSEKLMAQVNELIAASEVILTQEMNEKDRASFVRLLGKALDGMMLELSRA